MPKPKCGIGIRGGFDGEQSVSTQATGCPPGFPQWILHQPDEANGVHQLRPPLYGGGTLEFQRVPVHWAAVLNIVGEEFR